MRRGQPRDATAEDDADDPRTDAQALVIETGGFRFDCVFDATAAGLATASDPFTAAPDFAAAANARSTTD